MSTSQVALCGLGQMGLPVATRLVTAHEVLAYDVSAERRTLGEEHEIPVTDRLADLAAFDVIVLCLPSPAVSRSVVGEFARETSTRSLVIETSTVLPHDVREWATMLAPVDAHVVDAAILSGVKQMEDGRGTLLVGGERGDIEAVRSVLDVLGGAGWSRFGELGAGMAAKVVNNAVAHAVMVVLTEAFALAKAEGLDLADVAGMLRRSDGGLVRPLTHRILERVAHGDYSGGMPLEIARKDSTLALAMAQRSNTPLFATQAVQSVYDLAFANGFGRADYAAIAKLWEEWIHAPLMFEPIDEH